jgi:hypothetical protein
VEKIQNLTYQSECHEVVTDKDGRYVFYVPLNKVPADVKKLRYKRLPASPTVM